MECPCRVPVSRTLYLLLYLQVQDLWSRHVRLEPSATLVANPPFQPCDEVHSLGEHNGTKFWFLHPPKKLQTTERMSECIDCMITHGSLIPPFIFFWFDTPSCPWPSRSNKYGSSEACFIRWLPYALCQKKSSFMCYLMRYPSSAQLSKADFLVR